MCKIIMSKKSVNNKDKSLINLHEQLRILKERGDTKTAKLIQKVIDRIRTK